MRKLYVLLAIIAITQLTACAHHRFVSAETDYGQSYRGSYTTQYPQQSPYADPNYYSQSAQPSYDNSYGNQYSSQQQDQADIAQIIAMKDIAQANRSSGGGAVVGAIIGGIIGNQLGRGDEHTRSSSRGYGNRHYNSRSRDDNDGGRAVATLGGAVLGGMIGNEIDRSSDTRQIKTEISLRLSNGQVRNLVMDNPGHLRVGDRVRVAYQNGQTVILR